ncbi:MAG: tetratricopeptide repeat protein [Euryarchaeota archaeon]|nr:tetratricopeptide repeat protein [Euryarchaeota archaeon]
MNEMDAMRYFNRKDYRRALDIYLDMLEDAESSADEGRIAYNANLAGLCLYFLHRHEEAREYFNRALEHTSGEDREKVQKNIDEMDRYVARVKRDIEEINSRLETEEDEVRRGVLLSNLGILHYFLGNNEDAEAAFLEAEKIFKKHEDSIALGAIYTNLAMLYDDLRELDYLYRALDIFTESGHIKGQADVYHSLALHYVFQDELEEAYYFVSKEMEILSGTEEREMKRRCYELAADIAMEMGRVDEGMKFTEQLSKI